MGLPEFCRAVYKRKSPITNQAKFVQAVFQHAGSAERLDDEYARKIFTGAKPISEPQYESFPTQVSKKSLHDFLLAHLRPSQARSARWMIVAKKSAKMPDCPQPSLSNQKHSFGHSQIGSTRSSMTQTIAMSLNTATDFALKTRNQKK